MPSTDVPADSSPDKNLFYVADDRFRLSERVKRLMKRTAHAEFPHSRTRHLVSNVRIRGRSGDRDRRSRPPSSPIAPRTASRIPISAATAIGWWSKAAGCGSGRSAACSTAKAYARRAASASSFRKHPVDGQQAEEHRRCGHRAPRRASASRSPSGWRAMVPGWCWPILDESAGSGGSRPRQPFRHRGRNSIRRPRRSGGRRQRPSKARRVTGSAGSTSSSTMPAAASSSRLPSTPRRR